MSMSSSTAADSARYHAFDSLRAVAMLLGIVYHATFSFVPSIRGYYYVTDVSATPLVEHFGEMLSGFRIHLFFLIAGFFAHLLLRKYEAGGFLRNRLTRIFGPFLVAVVLFTVAERGVKWIAFSLGTVGSDFPTLHEFAPRPMYLWFLYYLSMIDVAVLAIVFLVRRSLVHQVVQWVRSPLRRLAMSPWKPLLLSVPAAGLLALDPRMQFFDFVPVPGWIAFYALFFAVGWIIYDCREELPRVCRMWSLYLVIAAVLAASVLLWPDGALTGSAPMKALVVMRKALYAWLAVLGLLGLFVAGFGQPSARARWLSDSSYWAYLFHYPVLIVLQIAVANVPLPAAIKLPLVTAGVVIASLVTYRYFVRYTVIGRTLNGPRTRPDAPVTVSLKVVPEP